MMTKQPSTGNENRKQAPFVITSRGLKFEGLRNDYDVVISRGFKFQGLRNDYDVITSRGSKFGSLQNGDEASFEQFCYQMKMKVFPSG